MSIKVKLQEDKSIVAGFISWARLEEQLRVAGEIKPDESITHLEADGRGIKYYVKDNNQP